MLLFFQDRKENFHQFGIELVYPERKDFIKYLAAYLGLNLVEYAGA